MFCNQSSMLHKIIFLLYTFELIGSEKVVELLLYIYSYIAFIDIFIVHDTYVFHTQMAIMFYIPYGSSKRICFLILF